MVRRPSTTSFLSCSHPVNVAGPTLPAFPRLSGCGPRPAQPLTIPSAAPRRDKEARRRGWSHLNFPAGTPNRTTERRASGAGASPGLAKAPGAPPGLSPGTWKRKRDESGAAAGPSGAGAAAASSPAGKKHAATTTGARRAQNAAEASQYKGVYLTSKGAKRAAYPGLPVAHSFPWFGDRVLLVLCNTTSYHDEGAVVSSPRF